MWVVILITYRTEMLTMAVGIEDKVRARLKKEKAAANIRPAGFDFHV